MIYYTTLTQDGRIGATSATHSDGGGVTQVEFPEDFDFERQSDWRLENDALVYDPLPVPEPEPSPMDVVTQQVETLTLAMADMIGGAL